MIREKAIRIGPPVPDLSVPRPRLTFQYRWTIEVFFRFFKHVLGCRHPYLPHFSFDISRKFPRPDGLAGVT